MPIAWFLALQFLREYRAQAVLTITAVSVGVAVMLFLSALINGLQASLIEQTLGTQPHLTIEPAEEIARPQRDGAGLLRRVERPAQRTASIPEWQRTDELVVSDTEVRAVSSGVMGNAFASRGNANRPVVLFGVSPERFDAVIPVSQKTLRGSFQLGGSEAAIGTELAQDLGVDLGDKLRIRTPEGRDGLLTVSAIFDLGSQQVNARWVLAPLRTAQTLLDLPGGANVIHVQVKEVFEAEAIAERLRGQTGLRVRSWMEVNRQLLVGLKSQSNSSYTIQFFVFLAVAMGIASVLVVSVVQRTREIGILRAIGTAKSTIFWVFVIQGGLMGLIGSVLGSGLGALLSVGFSAVARASGSALTFPMALELQLFVMASLLATVTGVLAAAFPARRAAALDPVEAIRHA